MTDTHTGHESWTTQQLDEIARQIQPAPQPDDIAEQWYGAVNHRVTELCKLFNDDRGDESILANKLVDSITHFFDRERSKIWAYAKAQRAIINKYQTNPSEVDENRVHLAAQRIERLREQYAVCNGIFQHLRDVVRHRVYDDTGISWDRDYRSYEMHEALVKRAKLQQSLTADMAVVNSELFESNRKAYEKAAANVRRIQAEMVLLDQQITKAKRLKGFTVAKTGKHYGNDVEHDEPAFERTAAGRYDA